MKKDNPDCLSGTNHRVPYKGQTLYVMKTDKSFDISALDFDFVLKRETEPTTLVGLGIISAVITLALQEGIDSELISSAIWTESRNKGDLADRLSLILVEGK